MLSNFPHVLFTQEVDPNPDLGNTAEMNWAQVWGSSLSWDSRHLALQRHSAPKIKHPALSTQHSLTQHSALSTPVTQHSALSTQQSQKPAKCNSQHLQSRQSLALCITPTTRPPTQPPRFSPNSGSALPTSLCKSLINVSKHPQQPLLSPSGPLICPFLWPCAHRIFLILRKPSFATICRTLS